MSSNTVLLCLYDQPIGKKVIKALVFHGTCLLVVMIGILSQHMIEHVFIVDNINFYCWVVLCMVPLGWTLVIEKRHSEMWKSFKGNPLLWDVHKKIIPFFCKLRGFRVIRTFGSFYRDLSRAKQCVFFIMILNFCCVGMVFALRHPRFPLLSLMGIFFASFLCRYVWILCALRIAVIVINDEGIIFPVFGVKKYTVFISWVSVTHLEIIGSQRLLYADCELFDETISFLRGLIIHCDDGNMCVVTDELLDIKSLLKLYKYANNYVGQKHLKLRLTYNYNNAPIYVTMEDETSSSVTLLAQTRLVSALVKVEKMCKK